MNDIVKPHGGKLNLLRVNEEQAAKLLSAANGIKKRRQVALVAVTAKNILTQGINRKKYDVFHLD